MRIVIIFIVILFVLLAAWFVPWVESRLGAKIKYKSFKTFYAINPNRWDLYDCYVECEIVDKDGAYGGIFTLKESFHFGPIDFLRYRLWMKNEEKREKKIDNANATAKMLASVKYDIEKTERQAKKYSNQAIDDMLQIVNNLKRSDN